MVPVSSFVVFAVCALFGIAFPVALVWWAVKRYHLKLSTVFIGAAVFFVFAMVLESSVHAVVLKGPDGASITGNVWLYALYGGLMAGLFEETGRFLAMKLLMKKEPLSAGPAVAYGLGHGGAEILLVFGLSMVSNLVLSALINSGQADAILSTVPADAQAQVQAQFAQLQTTRPGTSLLGIWERISALILHLGLSVMVWTAVRKAGKWLWLFPAAILLHAIVDFCTLLLSKSVSLPLLETLVFAMALAVGAIGFMLARRYLK